MTESSTPIHYFDDRQPEIVAPGVRTWANRGSNFVVCLSDVEAGARVQRDAGQQRDEYMVFVMSGAIRIQTETPQEEQMLTAGMLAIVPPGSSSIQVTQPGRLLSLYSSRADDIAALASNSVDFADGPAPGVAPLHDLSAPSGGYRLRVYNVEDYTKPESRMRIFRSANLMLNIMLPRTEPRDTTSLSPHSHADFEQGSLALQGDWVHHLRHPWGPDLAQWRKDEHLSASSPSLLVIPPTVIHTSMNVNPGQAWLVDIFAPPREDFCKRPGMICNADEYPLTR